MKSFRDAIVIIDPVTEWKPVVEAVGNTFSAVCITVQLSPISKKMKPFFPTVSMLEKAGVSYVIDRQDRDVYGCVQALKLLEQKAEMKINAVIPLSETAVDFSDTITALLGLRNHNTLETVICKRDKGFMKDAVQSTGLQIAKFARLRDVEQLQSAVDSLALSFPVVIKTPQGFSTTDVYICGDLKTAEEATLRVLSNVGPDARAASCALLEEYIGGTEFAVNLMACCADKLMVTDVWKYRKTQEARYQDAEMCIPSDPKLAQIIAYAKGVTKAVGVQYGAAHVEVKANYDKDSGSYVNPVMMEVGARLSGGRKATMVHAAYEGQWNPFDALIQSHLGQLKEIDLGSSYPLYVRHLFLPIERAGRIRRIESVLVDEGNSESIGAPGTLSTLNFYVMLVKEGDYVKESTDITSCAGFVWLVGDKVTVDKEADIILSSFKIELENRNK